MSEEATHSLALEEKRVQEFWEREGIAKKALALNPDGLPFRFTEGPPTANGLPHLGHFMTRALKDAILRHRRMKGFRVVSSMAGWDCHGLPVEVEVEKSHGWKSKKQISDHGVDKFIEECRQSVLTYERAWRDMSRQVGYWLDYEHPYFTMDRKYIESVWWSLKTLYERGYLEKGRYVVPYCPRCETPEAAHEVAQGYKETQDPSITVRLRLLSGSHPETLRHFLVWTTTPWTLPSNLALAVNPEMDYVVFREEDGEEYIMAASSLTSYFPSHLPTILERIKGKDLIGLRYESPFPGIAPAAPERGRVYPATFVSSEEGTGIVHIAPSYGLDDFALGEKHHLGSFDTLDASGRFTSIVPQVEGLSFKTADGKLLQELKERGLIWREERIRHTYPFCWRCNQPLIYRALDTWFLRTRKAKERLIANNAAVTWIPSHLRDGRFGNFLSEGKDWALSRNRYWGTPLPIWTCPSDHFLAVGSFQELSQLHGKALPDGFDPHKPSIDDLPLTCPVHGSRLSREPYVIDCWYDSGSAPFAQYHWPLEGAKEFDPSSPLDFIAEGLDQTRGWFYSMLVLSTLLFDRPAYRNVLVNGLAVDQQGQKMSKSKGNVTDPFVMMRSAGADAPRLATYFGPYTEPFRFSDEVVRLSGTRTLTTLLNVVEFYRSNRLADSFAPSSEAPHPNGVLDRWLLSRFEGMTERVGRSLDLFDPHDAATDITQFIDELSSWYLRRSRNRFWSEGLSEDKKEAYATLSFTLSILARVLGPLAPHLAEYTYQMAMATEFAEGAQSPHLLPWPLVRGYRDVAMEEAMARVMIVVEAGRNLRMTAGVKSRIPLAELILAGLPAGDAKVLGVSLNDLLGEELNVKRVTLLSQEEFAVRSFPEADWVLRSTEGKLNLALSRKPNQELLLEGLAREINRRIQITRKEMDLEYTDKISAELILGPTLRKALERHQEAILGDCQIVSLKLLDRWPEGNISGIRQWEDVGGERMALRLERSVLGKTE